MIILIFNFLSLTSLLFFLNNPIYSRQNEIINSNENLNKFYDESTREDNKSDIKNNDKSSDTGSYVYKRISENDFFYADTKRSTLNGEMPFEETHLNPLNAALVGASYAAIFYIQHKLQLQTIWKEQGEFKIQEDGGYSFYSDKAGHFFGTYFTGYLARETLLLTGMSWELSVIIGSALGLAYTTYVEVLDGFGLHWGFSPSDFYADIAGAALFFGQHYIPILQNFTPKFIYIPASWHGERERVPHDAFIDDYSSHTNWISANVHNMLPNKWKKYWPSWLELSFGYAVRGLRGPDNLGIYHGDKKLIISLDYNLIKLLPDDGSFWNWFRQSLNFIKFPAPALEFGSGTKFYLMYPFLNFKF